MTAEALSACSMRAELTRLYHYTHHQHPSVNLHSGYFRTLCGDIAPLQWSAYTMPAGRSNTMCSDCAHLSEGRLRTRSKIP
jgi:hypothetical protein